MEGNKVTAEFMACPRSAWLLLSFSLFPVRHPSLAVSNPVQLPPEKEVSFLVQNGQSKASFPKCSAVAWVSLLSETVYRRALGQRRARAKYVESQSTLHMSCSGVSRAVPTSRLQLIILAVRRVYLSGSNVIHQSGNSNSSSSPSWDSTRVSYA